jgi:hypothetical protein
MATRIDITVAATPGQATVHHSEPSPAHASCRHLSQEPDDRKSASNAQTVPDGGSSPSSVRPHPSGAYSRARRTHSFEVIWSSPPNSYESPCARGGR